MAPRRIELWGGLVLLACSASAASISGRVVADHSDAAVASAEVRFYKTGLTGLAADLDTDGEGRFSASELPEGDYRLEISKPNYLNATLRLKLSGRAAQVTARLIRCGSITGSVTDGQGQGVRGATVLAMRKPAAGLPLRPDQVTAGRTAMVDGRGQYRIFNLPPGEYAVAVSYGASTIAIGSSGNPATASSLGSGFLFYPSNARPQFLSISGGEEHHGIDFSLSPSAFFTVSGKVELPDPKFRFWLALSNPDQPALAAAVTQALADGSFHFQGISPGSYDLLAVKTGGARNNRGTIPDPDPLFARTRIAVGGGNIEGLSVTPTASRSATLTLRTVAGCPTTAQVVVSGIEDWGAFLETQATLKAGEETTVSGLAPTRYSVSVNKLGDSCFASEIPTLDLTGTAPSPLTVTLAQAGIVRGRINTGGRPPSDFAVMLVLADPTNAAESGVQMAVPDAESRVAFTGLRPGRYRMAAVSAADKIPAPGAMLEFEVRGGATAEIDLAAPDRRAR
jgi:hypothetical protein